MHSFLHTTLLTLRSPLILAKHSICLLSDLWLLSSLSHAFKAPCTPELILGANHHPLIPMAPGPHSLFTFTLVVPAALQGSCEPLSKFADCRTCIPTPFVYIWGIRSPPYVFYVHIYSIWVCLLREWPAWLDQDQWPCSHQSAFRRIVTVLERISSRVRAQDQHAAGSVVCVDVETCCNLKGNRAWSQCVDESNCQWRMACSWDPVCLCVDVHEI